MLRRTVLALVVAHLCVPIERLQAAPPATSTIVISLRYRFPSYGISEPATITINGPGFHKIITSTKGFDIKVNRAGIYFIQGEYRYGGKTMRDSVHVKVDKMGQQKAVTLLFTP